MMSIVVCIVIELLLLLLLSRNSDSIFLGDRCVDHS
jgi:hypothetical protein